VSALGSDDGGEPSLRYTWRRLGGPAAVTFSPNGTNAAKNATATFSRAGSYTLEVTIQDVNGLVGINTVPVTVSQMLTSVAVAPSPVTVQTGGSQTFTGTAQDQFGNPMPGSISWSVSGGGSINASGVFTAGATPGGPFTVTATSGGVSGTASVTVTVTPPTLTTIQVTPASASVPPLGSQTFSAAGYDQVGNPMSTPPSFSWSVSGGGAIDSAGVFTSSGAPGTFTVTASSGGVSGSATVTVPEEEEDDKRCGAVGLEWLAILALLAALRRRHPVGFLV